MQNNPTAVFLGDSITMGYGLSDMSKRYTTLFCEEAGFRENNYGITGTLMARSGTSTTNGSSFLDRYHAMENGDFIVVFGGTNDYFWSDTPMETDHSENVSCFIPAVHHLCAGLIEKYPDKPMVFILPYSQRGIGNFKNGIDGLDHNFHNSDTPNYTGHTLAEYVHAMKKICCEYGIPVLDLYHDFGIDIAHNDADYKTYTLDGCHPNEAGHARIAEYLYKWWMEHISE